MNPEITVPTSSAPATASFPTIELPSGLIGFPELTTFELQPAVGSEPFLWLQPTTDAELSFLAVEPGGVVADYAPELFEEDASWLELDGPEAAANDALILNIVTRRPSDPSLAATVNLVGPVVVNRRNSVGKQVILANHARYSARHPLVVGGPTSGG